MYIIDRSDNSTIKYCTDSNIYYIFYDYEKSKFYYSNSKEINKFSADIYNKMEINEPNKEMFELIKYQEESNDLSLFKKYFLNKKRESNKNEEDEEQEKKYKKEELSKLMTETPKKGYKNKTAQLIVRNFDDIEMDLNIENSSEKEEIKVKKISKEWEPILKGYNLYRLMVKKTNVCNAIFSLPIFYSYKQKYLIIKNEDNSNEKYLFYSYNTGKKLEKLELENAIDSLNIFSNKSEKSVLLNAYLADKKQK